MKKLLIVAAGVAGYVLGSRAGRERYDQIRTQTQKVWNSPTVQSGVDHASDAAKSAASSAASTAASAASTATNKVTDAVKHASDDEEGDSAGNRSAEPAGSNGASTPTDPTDSAFDAGPTVAGAEDLPASPAVTTPPTAADLAENEADRP